MILHCHLVPWSSATSDPAFSTVCSLNPKSLNQGFSLHLNPCLGSLKALPSDCSTYFGFGKNIFQVLFFPLFNL